MWLNSKEELIIGNFILTMEKSKENEKYEIEWSDNSKIIAHVDTVYEDDNGLDLGDEKYEEFWSVAVCIDEIVRKGKTVKELSVGDLIEINYHNSPKAYKRV